MAKVVLVPFLTKLCNKCLIEECFPDDFKLSHVIPIPNTAAPRPTIDRPGYLSIALFRLGA